MDNQEILTAQFAKRIEAGETALGFGAQFWAYVSPSNHTSLFVTFWRVAISQGNWIGIIDSGNPYQILQTPGLSGLFNVQVLASGPQFPLQYLAPADYSKPNIGCNSNCSAMVGIVANAAGSGANYWTTWDAICK